MVSGLLNQNFKTRKLPTFFAMKHTKQRTKEMIRKYHQPFQQKTNQILCDSEQCTWVPFTSFVHLSPQKGSESQETPPGTPETDSTNQGVEGHSLGLEKSWIR